MAAARIWLAFLLVFVLSLALAQATGGIVERAIVLLSLIAAIAAAAWRQSPSWGPLALALLGGATASLALRFLGDDFGHHLVWLLSAPELEDWLKLASLWASDEGTLLLLGLIGLGLAIKLQRHGGWTVAGAYLLAAAFIFGAVLWDPFRATPAEALAEMPYRGMNAHLTRVWMLVHPPLVFFAYLLLVAPCGAMAEALALGRGPWREIAAGTARLGWLLLSAGIAFGMWWAFEDFTYGTLWHWDPVQTSVFVAWALLTAMLHGQQRYRADGAFGIAHPLLGLLAAAAVMLSMAVTRDPALASSHQYVGTTSLPLLLGLAGGLVALALVSLAIRLWRRSGPAGHAAHASERNVLLWLAVAGFSGCALVALVQIGVAYAGAWQSLPRPEDLKPFFETLRNFTAGAEIGQLRAAFAQWDIDNFAMNRWLAPLACGIALVGGHSFMPLRRRPRWLATGTAVALGIAAGLALQPFSLLFEGRGLTSGKTVAIFPWLDLLLFATGYLILSAVLWCLVSFRAGTPTGMLRHRLPVAMIHAGVMLALVGGLAATLLDSYSQRFVTVPDDLNAPILFPGGYSLEIGLLETGRAADGARAGGEAGGFRSVAEVSWALERNGSSVVERSGHAVYRDTRPPYSSETGAVRLMCEMIDYRYARYRSDATQIIHPLISRGLLRDVQIWVPAVSGPEDLAAPGAPPQQGRLPVVLKVFPLMSWVWIGLLVALSGFLLLLLLDRPSRYGLASSSAAS